MSQISKDILFSLLLGWPAYQINDIREHGLILRQDNAGEAVASGLKGQAALSPRFLSGFAEDLAPDQFKKRLLIMNQFLREKFNIRNRDLLLSAIRSCRLGSHSRAQLTDLFKKAAHTGHKDQFYRKNNPNLVFDEVLFVQKNGFLLKDTVFQAFDVSMLVLLCRIGLYLEWLGFEEAVQMLEETAKEIKGHYTSYEEYYTEAAVAYAFFNREIQVNESYFDAIRKYRPFREAFAEYFM